MEKNSDKNTIKYIPIYIFNIFFRDKKFYKPKSTQGGTFYIDIMDELMGRDILFSSLLDLDIEEIRDFNESDIQDWTLKIAHIGGKYIKKLRRNLDLLEKNCWIEGVKLQIETKDTFVKKEKTSYGTIPAGNIINILLKITVQKIYWDKFINYIAEKRDEESLNWDIIGSSYKQKELIKSSIDTKRRELERNDHIIMVGSQNYGDYKVNIQFLKTIKELEKDGLIKINSICVRTKMSFRELTLNSTIKEYFDIRVNLSLTKKFDNSLMKIVEKKKEVEKNKNIIKEKKFLPEKPSTIEVRFAKDQFNKGIKIRGINNSQMSASNKRNERNILYLDSDGNLCRKLKTKELVYPMKADGDRFKIIEYLSKNRRYSLVEEILPDKKPQSVRVTISKIKKNIEKYLKIKGTDFIQSKKSSGYRINPNYKIKIIKINQ